MLECSKGKYDGEFQQGKKNGKGVFISKGGSRYDGLFVSNKFREGEVIFPPTFHMWKSFKGTIDERGFKRQGTLYWKNGRIYEGPFSASGDADGVIGELQFPRNAASSKGMKRYTGHFVRMCCPYLLPCL